MGERQVGSNYSSCIHNFHNTDNNQDEEEDEEESKLPSSLISNNSNSIEIENPKDTSENENNNNDQRKEENIATIIHQNHQVLSNDEKDGISLEYLIKESSSKNNNKQERDGRTLRDWMKRDQFILNSQVFQAIYILMIFLFFLIGNSTIGYIFIFKKSSVTIMPNFRGYDDCFKRRRRRRRFISSSFVAFFERKIF